MVAMTAIIPKGSSLRLKAPQRPPAFSSAAHSSQFNSVDALTSLLGPWGSAHLHQNPGGTSDLPPLSLQIRIWARPSAIDQGHGNYSLGVTGPILDFFSRHYDTPYPLKKSGE